MDTSLRSVWQGKISQYDKDFVILSVATQRVARHSRSKKIHTLKCKFALWFMDTSLRSVWQGKAQWQDKSVWQTNACHFELSQKAKNPQNLRHALKVQTRTLNSWILRFAQYDKVSRYDKDFATLSFCEKALTARRETTYARATRHTLVILSLCKRRKIHTMIYGYFASLSMTRILSFWQKRADL